MTEDKKPMIDLTGKEYTPTKSANGSKSKHNNDRIAQALNGQPLENVYAIAAEMTDIAVEDLEKRYEHLNPGQQRMNLGNRIRGAVTRMDKSEETMDGIPYLNQIVEGYPIPELEEAVA